jgi:hypothetical protein
MAKIPPHKRRVRGRWKPVKGYSRPDRGIGKRRIIAKKPVSLYPVRDEYGQLKGFARKRG